MCRWPPATWISQTRSSGNRPRERVERLPAVDRVGPDIVQVEQDAAIRAVGDLAPEVPVGKLAGDRPQVIGAGLEGERQAELVLQPHDPRADRGDALGALHGRHQETDMPRRAAFADGEEARMFAPPGGLQDGEGLAQRGPVPDVAGLRAADRVADAVDQHRPAQRRATARACRDGRARRRARPRQAAAIESRTSGARLRRRPDTVRSSRKASRDPADRRSRPPDRGGSLEASRCDEGTRGGCPIEPEAPRMVSDFMILLSSIGICRAINCSRAPAPKSRPRRLNNRGCSGC